MANNCFEKSNLKLAAFAGDVFGAWSLRLKNLKACVK